MSVGSLALITAATSLTAAPPPASSLPSPEPLYNDLQIALPSLDGFHGVEAGYERWIPRFKLSILVTGQARESAIGDYTGVRTGAGVEWRWFWRAASRWSPQPTGSMVGWYLAGRFDTALDLTHDREDHRWLDPALELGALSLLGYRLAPWRGLEITAYGGVGFRTDLDLSGRLPAWTRPTLAGGLSVGWMF